MEKTNDTMAWLKAAEVDLIYKTKVKSSERPCIKNAEDSYQLLLAHWDDNKIDFIEQFKVILLNRSNQVLGIFEVSTGCVGGTIADPKIIFTAALKANASKIILCHNHPSANLTPSAADIQLTARIAAAGNLLELRVADHLIISREGYYSFGVKGLL